MRNSTFVKIKNWNVTVIFRTRLPTQRQTYNCHYSLQWNILLYSSLAEALFFFYKSLSSTLPIAGVLINLFTSPFSYTKYFVRISGICGCNSKIINLLEIIRKKEWSGGNTFLHFVTFMKLNFFWIVEHCPQMNYYLVFQRKEGPILSYHVPKIPRVLNINFWFVKLPVPKRT